MNFFEKLKKVVHYTSFKKFFRNFKKIILFQKEKNKFIILFFIFYLIIYSLSDFFEYMKNNIENIENMKI